MSEEKKGDKSKRTRAVIDRIEDGGTAVLLVGEEEHKVELPAALLPEGAEGGSHLSVTIALDEASRKEAEERVKALQEKLEKRGGERQKSFEL
jgi:hypothetical protein